MHKQQGPTGQHRELYSVSKDKHMGKNRKKKEEEEECIYVYNSRN